MILEDFTEVYRISIKNIFANNAEQVNDRKDKLKWYPSKAEFVALLQ